MEMHNPPHPGEILLEEVIPGLQTTVSEFASHLGFAKETLSEILNGLAPVSPDLAVRLERAGISSARLWLSIQADHDLWQAERREQPPIEPYVRAGQG
ncbi:MULTISPECIES: HigA family addiction module antitoxin [Pseudomonas]|uniref:Virulence-associated protein n=4 Tax=Pseudomonas syringae group TaxID=136849 RepID=A0A7Z6XVQ1_PSESF|nr:MULTISPECIES: HigA family addiction module antitoxin [Pseudomonas]KTB73382.1 XRE family transcriptional regulator [Pseudomonas sp. ICMP 3272]KTC54752.1 XRE family transcriptional regulator [Pseudomonas syringae ICMP 19498]KTC59964.1 XRE family transcriptional regulator [Pseudomonas savastanoi]MDU8459040.1 HigA family addiction module antitoxin [Pseudomonas syringae group sp. J254-4]MDU8545357.1 HigA family addiction module antitoxin [Pseudomonas syringae group sp. J248-6]